MHADEGQGEKDGGSGTLRQLVCTRQQAGHAPPVDVYPQPPAIKAFIERVTSTPFEDIAEPLDNFEWAFEKVRPGCILLTSIALSPLLTRCYYRSAQGDFNQWVPLFNYFDSFLEEVVSKRRDLQLDVCSNQQDEPFPTANVLAVLRTTAILLENCNNKHLYQSYEVRHQAAPPTILRVLVAHPPRTAPRAPPGMHRCHRGADHADHTRRLCAKGARIQRTMAGLPRAQRTPSCACGRVGRQGGGVWHAG